MMGKKRKIIRDKLKDRTFNNFLTLFEKKEERKKKNHNGRINKNIIIRDIRTLFETKKGKEKETRIKMKK